MWLCINSTSIKITIIMGIGMFINRNMIMFESEDYWVKLEFRWKTWKKSIWMYQNDRTKENKYEGSITWTSLERKNIFKQEQFFLIIILKLINSIVNY